jgi:hypothetical protein
MLLMYAERAVPALVDPRCSFQLKAITSMATGRRTVIRCLNRLGQAR